ncbi:hypothetical protein [Gellertiella hungarica]|uniref:Uncharacterized protein n=1 Tax=Gellertiella hungarica TaxID=1572859 RepID=A0A7W6J3D2_9HYPH|nr:hypothetical protein [Gellertiella hungarica]MBB4064035.1 hypothetical protein [Gellertiella hungarica]
MKLVTWHEFISMPAGTVYSRASIDIEDLRIKGDTLDTQDFHETSLLPGIYDAYAVMDVPVGGSDDPDLVMTHPSGWGRDGMWEKNARFFIWEKEDRERLARWLLDPEAFADSDEVNEDNVRWMGAWGDIKGGRA